MISKNAQQFVAHIEFDKESNMYYGYVPSLPAVHSFAPTIDQLNIYLKEVLELCIEELSNEEIEDSISSYIGTSVLMINRCANYNL